MGVATLDPVLDRPAVAADRTLVDAAVRCIARWGLAKTTLDDIAREAGRSRATVYRQLPGGKDALVGLVVTEEWRRLASGLAERLDAAAGLEELLVSGITHAGRALAGHGALRTVLAHEPEVVLPQLAFARLDGLLATVASSLAPHLEPWVGPDRAVQTGEWLTRIVLSYSLVPSPHVDLTDDDSVTALVRAFLLPALDPS